MELWICDKDKLASQPADTHAYAFEVPVDGSFNFTIWAVWDQPPGQVELLVNDASVFKGAPAQDDPLHFVLGSVKLPRGRHKLALASARPPQRLLLSENPNVVADGKAVVLWDNREISSAFETRNRRQSESEKAILRRNGFLFERDRDAERCQAPSGVPLGGIGAGKVELTAQGFFTAATLNNNQDCPIYRMPGSFFALQVEGERTYTRLLQTTAVDQLFVPVQHIQADCAFPEARLTYSDAHLPVQAQLHAFSPHVPHDVVNSSLPCTFFRFTLTNPTAAARKTRLLFSWENTVNTGGHMCRNNQNADNLLPLVYHTWNHAFAWSNRQGNHQAPAPVDSGTALRFAADADHGNPSSFGQYMIWTDQPATVVPDRDLAADEERFSNWFQDGCQGEFQPAGKGQFRAGALIVEKTLAPGQVQTVDFILAWHMPRAIDSGGRDMGVFYAKNFPNVDSVLRHAVANRDHLLDQTRQVRLAMENSSLPGWFTTKLLDERFVATTCSTLDSEGRFSINEAPTGMCGCLGTLDQRTASGGYWTMFFPTLDAVELEMFTRCQEPTGCPAHDLGKGEFDLQPRGTPWPDLAASYVIQVHRHFLRTGDRAFLQLHWPFLKAAMDWAIAMDESGDAIPTLKPGRGTTYDNQQWDGISAFIATMHEAALSLAADLAGRMNQPALKQQWGDLAARAADSRKKYLWMEQGGYMRNAFDPATGKADDACFLAALAGDWAMLAGGQPTHLEPALLRRAVKGIAQRCLFDNGMTDQGGLANTQSAFMQYPMAYFAGAAAMLGLDDVAWDFAALQDRIITRPPSTRYIQILTYHPDGNPWGLPYYMTATASWLLLDALAGVVPDVDRSRLQLGTSYLWSPAARTTPVFLSSSWMHLEATRAGRQYSLRITPLRSFAPFEVTTLALRIDDLAGSVEATVNGQAVIATVQDGCVLLPVRFDPGLDAVSIELKSV